MRLPGTLLWHLLRRIPQIEAQRQLSLATAVAYGSGSLKKHDARRWWNQTQKRAEGGKRRGAARRPASKQEYIEQLRAHGFNVRIKGADGVIRDG